MTANKTVSADEHDALANQLRELKRTIDAVNRKVPNSLQPFIPVQLFRLFAPALQTATGTAQATVPASSAVGMSTLWQGRIGYCSHPCLSIEGMWGDLDSMTPAVIYQLSVGVMTFNWTSSGQVVEKHSFDISGLANQQDVQVTLSVTNVGGATGTDRILVSPVGCFLRQNPVDGIFG